MSRPNKAQYFTRMAQLVATRGTCARRKVGCVLVNARGHVLATGYNGVAMGVTHCIDEPCPGAMLKSGEGLDKCRAIHAEANALLQCRDVWDIDTVYCTTAPCSHCVKLLQNTSASTIVYLEDYPHMDSAGTDWLLSRESRHWYKLVLQDI